MPERWRGALGRVDELGPDLGLLERARGGPLRPAPSPRPSSRLVAGVLAFAVFAAAGVFAFRALDPRGVKPAGQTAGTPQILWPERVVSDAQAVQAQADAGDSSVQWRLDPKEVATRFGSEILDFGNFFGLRAAESFEPGTMAFELAPAPLPCPSSAPGETTSPCLEPAAARVTLLQPVGQGAAGLWSVSSVAAAGVSMDVQPGGAVGVGDTLTADVSHPLDGVLYSMGLIVEDGVKGIECSRSEANALKDGQISVRVTGPILCGADPIGYAYVAELRPNPQMFQGFVPPFDPLHSTKLWGTLLGLSIVPVSIGTKPSPSPSMPSEPPTTSLSTFSDPLGWSVDYPANWIANPFFDESDARHTQRGAWFSNVELAANAAGSTGTAIPDSSTLPAGGFLLTILHQDGGAYVEPASDSSFPLSLGDFRASHGPGSSARSYLSFRGDGVAFFGSLVLGPDVSQRDLADLRATVASIRMQTLEPRTTTGQYFVLDGADAYPVDTVNRFGPGDFSGQTTWGSIAPFFLVHTIDGIYSLGLEKQSGSWRAFRYDAKRGVITYHESGVEWTWGLDGKPISGPGTPSTLPIHPVVRGWDGHLLTTPAVTYNTVAQAVSHG